MRAWLIRWLGIESNDRSIWKMLAAQGRWVLTMPLDLDFDWSDGPLDAPIP